MEAANMKPAGTVRRVDDLGRVVIPKEIRSILCIAEGDPLEVYTNDGHIIFKKINEAEGISGIFHDLRAYIANDGSLSRNKALLKKVDEIEAEIIKAR